MPQKVLEPVRPPLAGGGGGGQFGRKDDSSETGDPPDDDLARLARNARKNWFDAQQTRISRTKNTPRKSCSQLCVGLAGSSKRAGYNRKNSPSTTDSCSSVR